jgi:hypothetical protein
MKNPVVQMTEAQPWRGSGNGVNAQPHNLLLLILHTKTSFVASFVVVLVCAIQAESRSACGPPNKTSTDMYYINLSSSAIFYFAEENFHGSRTPAVPPPSVNILV